MLSGEKELQMGSLHLPRNLRGVCVLVRVHSYRGPVDKPNNADGHLHLDDVVLQPQRLYEPLKAAPLQLGLLLLFPDLLGPHPEVTESFGAIQLGHIQSLGRDEN